MFSVNHSPYNLDLQNPFIKNIYSIFLSYDFCIIIS